MKEEKQIRTRKKSFKGSVLLTVVAVMMVMIVFVMATLTIAGAANKRAYASYSKNQTTYTAQAAIEATIEALTDTTSNSSKELAKTVNGLAAPDNPNVAPVTLTVDSPDDSMGTTQVVASNCYPGIWQLDEATGTRVKKAVIQLSATTTLGDESSTVSTYYIVDPVINNTITKTPSSSNGIVIMGSLNTTSFGFQSYGGAAIGVGKDTTRWGNGVVSDSIGADGKPLVADYLKVTYQNANGKAAGNVGINGSLYYASGSKMYVTENQGLRVFGDLTLANFGTGVFSNANTENYDSLPYIYVERDLKKSSSTVVGSPNSPFVIYCGGRAILDGDSGSYYGDIYIYNHDFSQENHDYTDFNEGSSTIADPHQFADSWSKLGSSSASSLLSWTEGLIKNSSGNDVYGGNIYTKGSLELGICTIGSTAGKGGNCYVAKDLKVTGNTTINGDLVVLGNVDISGNLTVKGSYYCPNIVNGEIKEGTASTDATLVSFPNDRDCLDDILIFPNKVGDVNSSDDTGFIETKPVESSHYLNAEGTEYNYPTSIDEIDGGTHIETANTVYSYGSTPDSLWSLDPTGDYTYEKKPWESTGSYVLWSNVVGTWEEQYCSNRYSLKAGVTVESMPSEITKDCTIYGAIPQNQNIYINPKGKNICVQLDNVSLNFSKIIVDNTNGGKVFFYVPSNSKLDLNRGDIITKTAYDGCYNGADLKSKYKDNDPDASKMIPNIYMYAGKENAEIYFGEQGIITGYIFAPYAHVTIARRSGYSPSTFTDSYKIYNQNKDANNQLPENIYNDLYSLSHTESFTSGEVGVIGAICAYQLSVSGGGMGESAVLFVDDSTVSKADPSSPTPNPNPSQPGVIITADNSAIQIISSYNNG